MKMSKGVGKFPENLLEHALELFTAFGVYCYDEKRHELALAGDAQCVRAKLSEQCLLRPSWICFSVAVECLVKAVLAKHECLSVQKGKVSEKGRSLERKAGNFDDADRVYRGIRLIAVEAKSFPWLEEELRRKRIKYLFDFNTKTLGDCIAGLAKLERKNVIVTDERRSLFNALQVLADVRRNIDAHTFYGLTVGGSFNGDLENLYLPAVNLLLDIYHR